MAGGSATITTSGKKTDIHQSSNKVILDWRSFDIGSDEHTQFHQPSKNAIALNRINDTKASQIDGKLTANGKIMLINPNGVVFGSGAQVDVGSLTATTADIDNDDFMAGKMDFKTAGSTTGAIVNNGSITVKDAGLVNFVAPRVENNGVIVAKLGKVQLAAADTFTIDMAGDGVLQVAVSDADSQLIAKNSGTISAEGGYVAVTAAKARGLVDSLVDNTGIIEASSMTTKGGKIVLSAHGGTTKNSGTIKANGKTGGGEILIGGDYQGVGDVKTTKNTEIAHTAVIEASATDTGDGGKVIVWADGNTNYAGNIKAQGGINGGNGGFVETSGKENLHVAEGSNVTASARHEDGEAGTWLLDPSNVTITNGSGNNIPGAGGTVNPATDGYTINAASINTALNGGNNVVITTTNGAGTEAGDITVTNATISKSTTNNNVTLSLRAARNITVENSTITATANSLDLTLNADRDANNTGAIKVQNSTINLNGGDFYAGGGLSPSTTAAIASQDGVFDAGITIDNSTIQTNGVGRIVLRGQGESTGNNNYGVLITNNSLLRTSTTGSSGTVSIYGTGGAGGSNNHGVYITNGSIVRSDRGATISGTGGSNGTIGSVDNVGVYIDGSANVQSRGTGAVVTSIAITGIGGNGYGGNHGFKIDGDSSYILVTDGDLVLNGTSGYNAALGVSPGTNYGVLMSTDSDITSNSATVGEAGNITINSVGENTVLGGDTITSIAGNITINADSLNMTLDALSSTSGNITIAPYTNSTSIGLGGGAGGLNLTDAELAVVSTAGKFIIGKAGTGTGDIDLDSWDYSAKAYSGIEIYGNDIDVGGLTMGTGSFLAHAIDNGVDYGDLNVSAAITRATAGNATLDLRADRNITLASNITTTNGLMNVILNSDRNANQNGSIRISGSTTTTNGGYFVAGGGSGTVGGVNGILGDGDGTGADDVAAWGNDAQIALDSLYASGIAFLNSSVTTNAGNIFMKGQGWAASTLTDSLKSATGIRLSGSSLTTTGGTVNLHGIGGGTTGSGLNIGVYVQDTSSITSTGGDITLYGRGGNVAGSTDSHGVALSGSTVNKITTTTGNISLIGETGSTSSNSLFLRSSNAANGGIFSLGSGTITLRTVNGRIDTGTATFGGNNATGDITLISDGLNLTANTTFRTTGSIFVKAVTNSRTIGLGGGTGDLNLSDAELGYFNAGNKFVIGDALTTGDIDLDSWDWSSKLFSVELYGNDIDIGGMTMGVGGFMAHAMDNGVDYGDLNISANITRGVNGISTLDLRADRNITNSNGADIIATDANSDSDGNPATSADSLNVILNADRDADQDGAVTLQNATITTLGGNFIVGGGSGAVGGINGILGDGDGTGADDIAAWGNASYVRGIGFYTVDVSTDAGGVYLTGQGYNSAGAANNIGVSIDGNIITTSGNIFANGTGGTGTQSNYGFYANGKLSSATGQIKVKGTGGGSVQWNDGILLNTNAAIESTGSATIDITGIQGTGTGTNGFLLRSGTVIGGANATGAITISADAFELSSSADIRSSGTTTVKAVTSSASIGLGGGSGTLNLDDNELSVFNGTGKLIIGDSVAGTGDIDLDSWNWSTKLFSGIELYGNDIDIGGMTMGAGNFMAYAKDNGVDYGDLNISANITRGVNGDATLDLRADRNITNSNGADIIASDANSDADGNPLTSPDRLNVILNADRNANNDGAISLTNAAITTLGGYFVAGGGSGTIGGTNGILGDGDGTGADDTMAWSGSSIGSGVTLLTSSVSTGTGAAILSGRGYDNAGTTSHYGVNLDGSSITTTSGKVQLNGKAGVSSTNAYGVQVSGSSISTATGDIHITGSANTSTIDAGVVVFSGSTIESTGSGSIYITGRDSTTGRNFSIGAAGTNRIGNAAMTGKIEINADTVSFSDTDDTILTRGDIVVKGTTASTSIGLGGGTGDLNLTDNELSIFNGTGRLIIGDSVAGTGDIDLDSWNWSSKLFNIELYGNDIDIGGMTMGVGNFMAYAKDNGVDYGDINISANITRSVNGVSTLDLRADRNIVNSGGADIIASDANSDGDSNPATDADSLNIILNADRNANQDGAVRLVNASINTLGGYFVAGGGSGALGGANGILGDGDGTGADDVAAWGNSTYHAGIGLGTSSINTASGNIYMKGQGYAASTETDADLSASGIRLLGSSLTTTGTGSINLHGTGGGTTASNINVGVFLRSGGTIQSAGGNINIYGRGGSIGSNSHGLGFSGSGVNTITTATGHIDVKAEAADATRPAIYGASIGGGILSTGTGTITLTALNSSITTAAAFTIGGATAAGNITLDTDLLDLAAGTNIQTSGDILVTPRTASRTIGLGGGTGDLNLTDAELGYFNGTGKLIIGNSAAGTGDIDLDSWNWSSKNFTGIEIYGNDIDIGGITMGTGNFLAHARDNGGDYGDLNISADITRAVNGNATLELRADHNITNSGGASIIASDANSDGDANALTDADRLNVILNADRNGTNDGGTVNLASGSILANGGNISLGGGNGVISAGSGFAKAPTATYFNGVYIGGTIDAQGGNVVINGDANGYFGGVAIAGTGRVRTSGTGTIDIYGIGGTGNGGTRGVSAGSGSIISNNAGTGTININGRTTTVLGTDNHAVSLGGSILSGGLVNLTGVSTYNGHGVNLANTGTITTTGASGGLNITGTAQGTGYNGINFVTHASNTVSTESGDITLTSLAGDIFLDKGIRKTGTGVSTLTIRTPSNIILNANADITATNGSLNVVLNADRDANNSGAISMTGVDVTTLGGYLVAGGGSGTLGGTNGILGDGDGTGADDVAAWANNVIDSGLLFTSSTFNTGAGDIFMKGHGFLTAGASNSYGMFFSGSTIDTTTGDVNIHATSGDGVSGTYVGMSITTNSSVTTDGGDINLHGIDNSVNGNNGRGLIVSQSTLLAKNNGSINLIGESDLNGTNAASIRIFSANIETRGLGDITFDGSLIDGSAGPAGSTYGGAQAAGDITFNTDTLTLATLGSIQTSGDIYVTPKTASRTIGIGGGTGDLNLTDAELAIFNGTGKLVIGDAANGTGDIDVDSWNLSTKSFDVELYGNDIDLGGLTMGAGDFIAQANDNGLDYGDLTISDAITRATSGTSTIDLRADRNIIFDTAANITSTTGEIQILIDSDYDNAGGGTITYNATSIDTNGGNIYLLDNTTIGADATWNARGGLLTTVGTITMAGYDLVITANDVALGGNITGTAGSILTLKPFDVTRSIGLGGGTGDFNLTDAELAYIGTDKLIIGDAASGTGDIDVDSWNMASKSFDVELYGNDIDLGGLTMGTGDFTAYAKDNGGDTGSLTVSNAITRNAAGTSILNLFADTAITFNNGANITATTGNIDLTLDADYDNAGGGAIAYNTASIDTNGGDIDILSDATIGANATWNARGGTITTAGEISLGAFDLDLIANNLTLGDDITGTAGSVLTLKPFDVARSIGLGGGTGNFNLTDVELDYVNTDKLVIGDAASGVGDIDLDSWNLASKSFDVELYGNDIDIGGLTMGAGDFMAYAKDNGGDVGDLTMSAAVTRSVAGTSALDLRADRNIVFNSGADITSTTGEIDLIVDANYDNVGTGVITYNASSIDTNGGDITMAHNVTLGTDANWNARGGTFTTGGTMALGANDLTVIADNVTLGGNITGTAASILTLKPFDNTRSIGLGGGAGDFNLTDAELAYIGNSGALVIGDAASGTGDIAIHSWSLSGKSYDLELYGRDIDINGMTMGAGNITMIAGNDVGVSGAIGNSGAGGDLFIDVGNDFVNTAGASAITMGTGGRFLIYIDQLSNITRGGMTTGNLFNRDFASNAPGTINNSFGNRFVFAEQPTLTVEANDVTLGAYDGAYNGFTYTVTGLATGDTAGSALSGTPTYGKTQLTPTTYTITPGTGTLTSTLGYLIAFQNGLLTMPVDPGTTPPPTPTPNPTPTTPVVTLPPSVERQIQIPKILFNQGDIAAVGSNFGFMDGQNTIVHRKDLTYRVTTPETDAFTRLIEGGYLQIEQEVIDYYELFSYNAEYGTAP